MSNVVGSLRVLLGLDAAEFVSGVSKAEAASAKLTEQQKRNAAGIDKQIAAMKRANETLGMSANQATLFRLAQRGATDEQLASAKAALGQAEAFETLSKAGAIIGAAVISAGVGLVAMVKSSIDAADHLNDLSKKTGIAVETLGGIGYAAEQAGGDLNSVAGAIGKLNKTIVEAAGGNEKAIETFEAMGIAIKGIDGNLRPVEQVLSDVAEKFSQYEDTPERAALALKLFGKSGADIIPLLVDGSDKLRENIAYYKQHSGVTADLAAKSDEFNDALSKLGLLFKATGNSLATSLLPQLQSALDILVRLKERTYSAGDAFSDFFHKVAENAQSTAASLLPIGLLFGKITRQIESARGKPLSIDIAAPDSRELARFAENAKDIGYVTPKAKIRAPVIEDPDKKKQRDTRVQELKKTLDGQIKLIQGFAKDQAEAYQFANQYAQGRYNEGLISQREFFADQQVLRDAALKAQVTAIDKEIALQRDAATKLKGPDRIDAENKVAEAIAKRGQAVEKARQDQILAEQQQREALEQTQRKYDELGATIRELSGDAKGAADIRIGVQVQEARKTITQAGGDPAQADLYKARLEQTEDLKRLQEDYNRTLERARNAEEDIATAATVSGTSELDVMRQVGQARAESLKQLDELSRRAAELALTLGTPEAIAFAEQLSVGFRKAAAEVDPLLSKVRDLAKEAGTAIADNFGRAITQGQSLRETIQGIASDLLAITTRELITKPLGGAITGVLNGNGSGGGLIASIAGYFGGGKAIGGPVAANSIYQVAENRPEMLDVQGKKFLLMGNHRGNIDPNPQMSGGRSNTNVINISVPQGTSRQTADQIAARISRQLAIAGARGN